MTQRHISRLGTIGTTGSNSRINLHVIGEKAENTTRPLTRHVPACAPSRMHMTKQMRYLALILGRSAAEVVVQFFRHDDLTATQVRRLRLALPEWFGVIRKLDELKERHQYDGWWNFLMSIARQKVLELMPKKIPTRLTAAAKRIIQVVAAIAFRCPAMLDDVRHSANEFLRHIRWPAQRMQAARA